MKRRERIRPAALSDDVLTAATKAAHLRLSEMACNTNLEDECINMLSIAQQLTSGVKIDVRSEFEHQLAMNTRIAQWIEAKATARTSVTIGQLASHLKIRKEFVPQHIEALYRCYGHNDDERFTQLWIFVEDDRVPAWLQTFLSPPIIHRLRNKYRNRDCLDQLSRSTMRIKLHALPEFKSALQKVWEHGQNAIVRALYTTDFIDNTDGLNYPINIAPPVVSGQMRATFGQVRPGYTDEPSGVHWTLGYAELSYTQLDRLDLKESKKIKVEAAGAQRKVKQSKYTPQEIEDAQVKIQKLIDWMIVSEYALSGITFSMNTAGVFRPVLIFAGKSGIGETISVRLPFPGLRVKRA